ncbi:MAG: DUF4880 domain-containing protein [Phenylobacterium sp.]|uniref:FecR/PupR family sigma factor regulator n=1 Tax=Phenylobacterium sp. TaxID=1871053 RepID=UPI0012035017|nr:DUF4880 domain-containing protein [Phenylobacterium sp.]TAJ71389.1 MAG: DUF4880 domain-containing protein [Phenylobacterium sp.]
MPITAPHPGLGEPALEEALSWLLRLREDLSLETVEAFAAWCAASPSAGEAWDEALRLWTLAGVALAVEPAG